MEAKGAMNTVGMVILQLHVEDGLQTLFGSAFSLGSLSGAVFRAQPDRVSTLPEIFGSVAIRVSSPRPVLPASRKLQRP